MLSVILLLATIQVAEPTSAQIEQAVSSAPATRRRLNDLLLDYPSTRFRDVYVTVNLGTAEPRKAYLCGFLNSKNRMGAYTGWTRFTSSGDFVQIKSGDDVGSLIVDAACGDGGQHAADGVDRSALLVGR